MANTTGEEDNRQEQQKHYQESIIYITNVNVCGFQLFNQ